MSVRAGNSSISFGTRPLQLEVLERRELLAVAVAEPRIFVDGDVLRIYGTSDAERVIVGSYHSDAVEMVSVSVSDAGNPADEGTTHRFEAAPIRKIFCRLEEGDDFFRNDAGIFSMILGNAGNDTLIGGSAYDRIFGGSQDDLIEGRGSRDVIQGAGGNDTIDGGDGDDLLKGQAGHDVLLGGNGNDEIHGGAGNDTIDGGEGADLAYGQTGNDTLYGGAGNDVLYGRNADDVIYGGEGDDRLYGGGQNDKLYGEAGQDRLFGTAGQNLLDGGADNDGLYGGRDDDQLSGGSGNDVLRGYGGNDTLRGDAGNDRLFGGDDNDTLYGGDGADLLFGQAGDDGLFGGGAEADALSGGAGSDRFLIHGADTADDKGDDDAELQFLDGAGQYTATAAPWTDAAIEKCDRALECLHAAAGTALILADSLSSEPVRFYLAESISFGTNTSGLNHFDGYRRDIYVKNNVTDEIFAASIIHEFSHCWDSTLEHAEGWNRFLTLHDQSSGAADYARDYGEGNAQEDWATNWEYYFGYYHWAAPRNPTNLFSAKQDAVDDFFAGFRR